MINLPHHWVEMAKTPNLLSPKGKIMGERERNSAVFQKKKKIKEKQGEERVSQSRGLEESGHWSKYQ